MKLRISDSMRIGPFRVRVSKTVGGGKNDRRRTWVSVGTRTPLGYLGVSKPLRKRGGKP